MAPSGTREAAANGTKDVGVNAKVSVERDRERRPEEAQKPWRSRISPRGWAAIGTGAVLAASPALELLTGDATLYSLPPLVLLAVFWNRTGLGRREVGFVSGRGSYQTAILHPLLVVGGIVFLATAVGVTRVDDTPVRTVALQVSMMTAVTALGALITEDGFFRGWLWATLERSRLAPEAILMWTAFAFAAWHLPVALIEPSFRLPVQQLPVHMLNVWLLGMSWGVLRLVSGSVLVAAISHGLPIRCSASVRRPGRSGSPPRSSTIRSAAGRAWPSTPRPSFSCGAGGSGSSGHGWRRTPRRRRTRRGDRQ
jgi:membrane protease YdiL (CAAX protease family)